MPYTTPTYQEFIARFPIFEDKDETTINLLLTEAANTIDKTWIETDYQPAIMYLAAHLLATDNSGEGEEVEVGGANTGTIASESFGPMSVSYANGGAASGSLSSSDQYGTTVYGRRFLALLKRNKPAIVAV